MKTLTEIQNAYRSKKASPVEVTQEFLKRAKTSKLNAFLTLNEDGAMKAAKHAGEVLDRIGSIALDTQPLLGAPIGIKDVLVTEGVRTTCASKMLENYIPPYTATSVERLMEAGAVSMGKLNMDEFAMGGSNENSAFGPVDHPTHAGYVPGGSSGGSAAAVRAELCAATLGTDTGGSIRQPASFCGIVGVKPTYGRISRYGLVAFASSLDQVGPMTHSVEDAALLMDVMSGHDPKDSTSAKRERSLATREFTQAVKAPTDWSKVRVGVPKEYFIGGGSAEVESAITRSLKWMEAQGAKLVPVSLPHTDYAVAVYYIVAVSEASSNLARFDGVRFGVRPKGVMESKDLTEFYKTVRSNFGPEVKRRIILGTFALSSGYYDAYYRRACQVRALIKRDFDEAFKSCDLIAAPVAPTPAFKRGEKASDPLQMYLMDIFTIPVNLAGLPAMSLPCGETSSGLPIGLQLIAPAWQEARMLSAAASFEKGGGGR